MSNETKALSISFRSDDGCIEHNNRDFFTDNVDKSRTPNNITYVKRDLRGLYHELFDEALAEYNARQNRPDRQIQDYYEHIRKSKKEKLFQEIIVMFGNSENCGVGSENWETAKIMLEEYIYNEMLHSDDSSYGKLQMAAYMGKVVDEIEAGVGNTILSAILRAIKEKAKNPPEQNSASTNRYSEWQRQCTVQLISSVGKLLGQFSNHSRDRLHDASSQVFGRGDLSKEQIRELLLKKQDKENTAEM